MVTEVFQQQIIINVQNKSQLKTCGFSVGSDIINAPSMIVAYEGGNILEMGEQEISLSIFARIWTYREREESETG